MKILATNVIKHLNQLKDDKIAKHSQSFFKTKKGEYGYGDIFLGIRVPVLRKLVKDFKDIDLKETIKLLKSEFHEARLLALFLLIKKYSQFSDENKKNEIYKIYLKHTKYINNWDLVDSSAAQIVGTHLIDKDKDILYKFSKSKMLWERRIAIIATFHFIKQNNFDDCLCISKILLNDSQDLIHKAVGWMIREIGKRNLEVEEKFLKKHYKQMPRTMLRYAIEKFDDKKRLAYLKGKI